MPITWITLVTRRPTQNRTVPLVTVCLLVVSAMVSLLYLQSERVASPSTFLWFMMLPLAHADYLHLSVNLLGGLLVLSRIEEKGGWRQILVVVCISYGLHVCLLAVISAVFAKPIDILGLSSTVYSALGFYFKDNLPYLSNKEKTSFVPFLVLMLILDISLRSIIVHLVALAFGMAVSSVMAYRQSKSHEIIGINNNNE